MKTIYYLTGLPRAGNTLLSSILNQNSQINTTALSYVNFLIRKSMEEYKKLNRNFPDDKSFKNAINGFFNNYYKEWSGDIIIQRTNAGHFQELEAITEYLKNDFKCIVLVRDIFEVLCSFIKLYKEDPNYFLNKRFSTDLEKINFILDDTSVVEGGLQSIYNLYYGWYDNCLFIQYNDLITNTKKQIDNIYDFLKIEPFNHSYENLNQFKVNNIKYDDSIYGEQLHIIKTNKIEKTDNSHYMKYIPDNIFKKFETTNNWLNDI